MLTLLTMWMSSAVACPPTTEGLGSNPEDARLNRDPILVVFKENRQIGVYRGGMLARDGLGAPACYRVALASTAPEGPKRKQGDMKTPEGWYRTSDKPTSRFYGAIAVHYPNVDDARLGVEAGLIDATTASQIRSAIAGGKKPPQTTALGGEILIHGGGSWVDWTLGCVALDNADLDRLRAMMPESQATDVLILP